MMHRLVLKNWLLLGPIASENSGRLEEEFFPEADVAPSEGETLSGKKWGGFMAESNGLVDFLGASLRYERRENAVAYAFAYLYAPSETSVVLSVGSDDGLAVFFNGRRIWLNDTQRSIIRGEDTIPLNLDKGWNRLLLKVSQVVGAWCFMAELCSPNQRCLDGLQFRLKNPSPERWPALSKRPPKVALTDILAGRGSVTRGGVKFVDLRVGLKNLGGDVSDIKVIVRECLSGNVLAKRTLRMRAFSAETVDLPIRTEQWFEIIRKSEDLFDVEAGWDKDAARSVATRKDTAFTLLNALGSIERDENPGLAEVIDRFSRNAGIMPLLGHAMVRKAAASASESIVRFAQQRSGQYALIPLLGFLKLVEECHCKEERLYLVGHAHIDMNWQWRWPETLAEAASTFRQAIKFMEEYPGFCFSQSQAAIYEAVEREYPDLFAAIKKYARRKQWNFTGGLWTESDINIPSGEALARSFLFGQRYFKEKFGSFAGTGWLPDIYGHSANFPQMLRKSGIENYFFCRCGPGPAAFWWKGIDGSRVIACHSETYSARVTPSLRSKLLLPPSIGSALVSYGVGNHGGGPTRKDIETALNLKKLEAYPDVKLSRADDFYDDCRKRKVRLPVVSGELQYWAEGGYTTGDLVKQLNRQCENSIYSAEVLSVLAWLGGAPYPQAELRASWKKIAFHQFHDIINGTTTHDSGQDVLSELRLALVQIDVVRDRALRRLEDGIDTTGQEGIPVVVWNTLFWPRTDLVSVEVDFMESTGPVQLVDDSGVEVPVQVIGVRNVSHAFRTRLVFVAGDIPPAGYKVYYARRAEPKGIKSRMIRDFNLENEFFRLSVDRKTGNISSLYDKRIGKELVRHGKQANELRVDLEAPGNLSAWLLGRSVKTFELKTPDSVGIGENGNVMRSIVVTRRWRHSVIRQVISLVQGLPRVECSAEIMWNEQGNPHKPNPMLRAAFPWDVKPASGRYDVPFGSCQRPLKEQEVPVQKWAEFGNDKMGVALLNLGKCGHMATPDGMTISLLRTPFEPDPLVDYGLHRMSYAVYPHKGSWKRAQVWKAGIEYNMPLAAYQAKNHKGRGKLARLEVSGDVVVTGVKKTEDGASVLIRFYEPAGKQGRGVVACEGVRSWFETDLIESSLKKAANGKRIGVRLSPFEIKTIVGKC